MKISTFGIALGSLGLAAAALLAMPAAAQVTRQGSGYLMRVSWKKGASYKFTVGFSMGAPAGSPAKSSAMNRQSSVVLKVADVSKGVASVEIHTDMVPKSSQNAKPPIVKMNDRGRVVGDASSLSLLIGLPEKPVKVGETWKDTFQARNQMGAPMTVYATYTLKAVKGGVAEITASNRASGGTMSMSGTGTYTLDLKDGMLRTAAVKQTVTVTMSQTKGGAPKKSTFPTTVTLSRV